MTYRSLQPDQRLAYYKRVCGVGRAQPVDEAVRLHQCMGCSRRRLQSLLLYATKDATEQLRALKGISITSLEGEARDGLFWVVAKARDAHGRTDAATGAVAFGDDLKGEARANAVMKAETKAKRRVTLSLAGLGFVDESEVGSIPNAQIVNVDTETGELPGPVHRSTPVPS